MSFFFSKSAAGASEVVTLGPNTVFGSDDTWGADTALYQRYQAAASGTLKNGLIYVTNTAVVVAKIAIYGIDLDSVADGDDVLIATSNTITASGSAGWQSAAFSSGTVTAGQFYWMAIFLSAASPTWAVKTENAAAVRYKASSGYFASPPANLSGAAPNSGTYGRLSAYVTCQ